MNKDVKLMRISDYQMNDFLEAPLNKFVKVPIIVIYKNPKDYQDKFVARLWDINNKPTKFVVIKDTLDEIRNAIPKRLKRIPRIVNDDPVIIETYL